MLSIRNVVRLEEIPQLLSLTGTKPEYSMCQCQAGQWKQGTKWIEVAGKDDKRQITAVFGASMEGDFCLYNWFIKVNPLAVYLK